MAFFLIAMNEFYFNKPMSIQHEVAVESVVETESSKTNPNIDEEFIKNESLTLAIEKITPFFCDNSYILVDISQELFRPPSLS